VTNGSYPATHVTRGRAGELGRAERAVDARDDDIAIRDRIVVADERMKARLRDSGLHRLADGCGRSVTA
jgi:hypothetical protein